MTRSIALGLVACFASACSTYTPPTPFQPRALPVRTSPVLEVSSEANWVSSLAVRDARRDGVYTRAASGMIQVIRREEGTERMLFQTAGYEGWAQFGALASRSDSQVVLAVDDENRDRLVAFDGSVQTDLSARVEAAAIVRRADPSLNIEAVDIDADGTIALALLVGGQAGEAPFHQLCFLRNTGDVCEGFDALGELSMPDALVFESGTVTLLMDNVLHARDTSGAWTRLASSAWDLRGTEDGHVVYFTTAEWPSDHGTFHIVGDATAHSVLSPSWLYGHTRHGLWNVRRDWETTRNCGVTWSTCNESTIWEQLVLIHIALDGTETEVGHFDNATGSTGGFSAVGLSDGSVRIETGVASFTVAPPR